jgi:hypothetical protein
MTNITFIDALPETTRTGYKAIVATLKQHPDKWAIVSRNTHKGALGYVRKHFPNCEWAMRKEKQPSGQINNVLYGRYIGDF